jgi:hypothetical protein
LSPEPQVVFARGDPGLAWCELTVTHNPLRRSPRELRRRLNALSDRHGGTRAITQSTRAIPQAYRRLDPERPSPAEELTLKRLVRGQYRSRGVLRDALLIATVDTEVGVWALDADRLHGVPHVGDGIVADGAGPIAEWFADPGYVTRATRRLVLYALVPLGVPDGAVEEALLTAAEIIASEYGTGTASTEAGAW